MNRDYSRNSIGGLVKSAIMVSVLVFGQWGLVVSPGFADDTSLAKQLANPVSSLVSVPFQFNFDTKIGPLKNGSRATLNIQPVIPIRLNSNWNLVSRTIVPIISQRNIFTGAGSQFGLGDVVQSFFFTPAQLGSSGIIWGIGPVFLIPSGSHRLLSARKWGAGPTAVVLKQTGSWSFGALANHIRSFAGDSRRPDVNLTFIQPFLSYTTSASWTFSLAADATYDWQRKTWTVPITTSASKLLTIGKQPVSVGAAIRYWAKSTPGSPNGWAARLNVTFLFPK